MRIWTCWQTRRRIPHWIRGACPSSEAAAVSLHVARCPACANEVALEIALAAAADADGPAREPGCGQATWTRLAQAIATAPPSRSPGALAPRPRLRLGLAAGALVLALLLGARWWSDRQEQRLDRARSLDRWLWATDAPPAADPLLADPMGPTTHHLLVLLEGKR